MSASLVGSEMCIRDSLTCARKHARGVRVRSLALAPAIFCARHARAWGFAVSYTHLTLPTICSV
eukprot:3956839-Alexandrium_andersonii.AAC.1